LGEILELLNGLFRTNSTDFRKSSKTPLTRPFFYVRGKSDRPAHEDYFITRINNKENYPSACIKVYKQKDNSLHV
jgi:hypothetical protein